MRKLPVATLALAALLLSGCVQDAPKPTVSPSPTATPVFASEEEALAAAEAAYGEYEAAVDRSLSVIDAIGLDAVAAGDALRAAIDSVGEFRSKGQKQSGVSSVDTISLVQASSVLGQGPIDDPIQIYGCLDISKTDVLGPDGASVLPADRQDRFPVVVELIWSQQSKRLLVSSEQVWDGDDFCAH